MRVLDNFSNGRESNLRAAAAAAAVVRGSILDDAALDAAIAGAEIVFHHAAMGSVPRSLELPTEYHENNVTGTMRVLEAVRRHGVRRFVYAASSSAYGNTATLPKAESMRSDTLSPYAYTKLAGEYLARSWSNCYGIEAVCLRYFNIFGPRQRHDSPYAAVVPMFIESLRRGERPIVFGDGAQSRDFTFVGNAVHANLLAGRAASVLSGQTVNIACGTRFSLLDLIERLQAQLGSSVLPDFRPARRGDVRDSEADISAAGSLLGYSVIVPFDEGLRITVESMVAPASAAG